MWTKAILHIAIDAYNVTLFKEGLSTPLEKCVRQVQIKNKLGKRHSKRASTSIPDRNRVNQHGVRKAEPCNLY